MRVLKVRNVQTALNVGMNLLKHEGVERNSRNGPVLVAPWPVTTVYQQPSEKITFQSDRDVNIAFLVYEALWMLAGRNDLEPLTRYVKDFGRYSDDGRTLHGAYGYRWRRKFSPGFEVDQLQVIARRLQADPEDRRCILQMWATEYDLDATSKDVPCNVTATLQRDADGRLDLTVFCRSNDIIWGSYFANAFHFATLLEYMAARIGCPVGVYRQVSVNWHAYRNVFDPLWDKMFGHWGPDPYAHPVNGVRPVSLADVPAAELDAQIAYVLGAADAGFDRTHAGQGHLHEPLRVAYNILLAHHLFKTLAAPERFTEPFKLMASTLKPYEQLDWVTAMYRWLFRRYQAWEENLKTKTDANQQQV